MNILQKIYFDFLRTAPFLKVRKKKMHKNESVPLKMLLMIIR